jgi:hypothetical protein
VSLYLRLMKENTTFTLTDYNNLPSFLRILGTGCRFVTMETETEVKMNKTGNPYLGTVKVCRRNGLVNVNFVDRVIRRMKESGIEKPDYVGGKTHYVHENDTTGNPLPLCQSKKDNSVKYLQFYPHRTWDTRYVLNGKELTKDEVTQMKSFIPEKDWGEYKQPVIVLKMSSIKRISFRKINVNVLNINKYLPSVGNSVVGS